MTITMDSTLLPRSVNAELRNFAKSGGRTFAGTEPRIFNDAGLIEIAYERIAIRTMDQALAYRAMMARLRQGEDIVVPVLSRFKPPGASTATVTVKIDTAAGSTAVTLTALGVGIKAGHSFSIGNRFYFVTSISSGPSPSEPNVNQLASDRPWDDRIPMVDNISTTADYVVNFLPPLRALATATTPVTFDELKLLCVLKDLGDGDIGLDNGRFGFPSLTFIESI